MPFAADDSRALTVGVQSIIATGVRNGTVSFTSNPSSGFLALIDSTVTQMWLPKDICDQFATQLGLEYDNSTNYYVINQTNHENLVNQNPSFTFKIGQTSYDNGQSVSIVFPYTAFDLQVGWPIYSSTVNYFPIRQANQSQFTLGRAFLQQAHITVDYGRQNFSVSQAIFPAANAASSLVTINQVSNGSSSGHKISGGVIAGIAVAAVAGIGLLILALVLFWRRRKQGPKKNKASELDATSNSDFAAKHGLLEADGDQVMEMSGEQEVYKPRLAELASPPVIYEMEGDSGTHNQGNGVSPAETGRTLTPQTASSNRGSTPFSPVSGRFSGYGSQPSPLRSDNSPHGTQPSPIRQDNLLSAPQPSSPSQPSPLTDQFSHGQPSPMGENFSQSQPSPVKEEHLPHE
jgi:hypothetical protein